MSDIISTLELSKVLFEILNDYFKGNREKIKELEQVIEELDDKILEKLSKESPEKIVDYLAKKVDLYLKIEDLKVKQETSFMNWLKNWSPVIIPIVVAVTTTLGVVIGTQLNNSDKEEIERKDKEIEFERQLILKVFEGMDYNYKTTELKRLINVGLINEYNTELNKFLELGTKSNLIQEDSVKLSSDTIKYATQQ